MGKQFVEIKKYLDEKIIERPKNSNNLKETFVAEYLVPDGTILLVDGNIVRRITRVNDILTFYFTTYPNPRVTYFGIDISNNNGNIDDLIDYEVYIKV